MSCEQYEKISNAISKKERNRDGLNSDTKLAIQ